jgi:aldose 1-epimerase
MSADSPFATRTLAAGAARLVLVPEAGGAIAAWRIGDQSMLYESGIAAAPDWNPLTMASFPLVPYSNRIADGCFLWDGLAHRLPPNKAGFAHPLHGVGWLRGWTVTQSSADQAVLRYEHDGDADWPWAFSAEQRFALAPAQLTVDLTVTNRSEATAPLAIGMHPYFDATGAHLQFTAAQMWLARADQLPVRAGTPDPSSDFAAGRAVAGRKRDNCYDGWDGRATIWWIDRPLALRIQSDLPCAVVYTSVDSDFFCFEPVPHSNNALNLGAAGRRMPVAAPGETIGARIVLDAWERT